MQHRRHKLAFFLAVQVAAVGAMISVLRAGRGTGCELEPCAGASAVSVIVTLVVILGELGIVAAAVRVDGPVWKTLAGLGILALIVAAFVAGFSMAFDPPRNVADVAVRWHVGAGLLLLATGMTAGVWELVARLRRPDDALPEDQASSAMWPLD